jgi:hypothetical protein
MPMIRFRKLSVAILFMLPRFFGSQSYCANRIRQRAVTAARDIAALNRFQPRSNSFHSFGQIRFGYQTATDHGMDEGEQLTLWRRNVSVSSLCQLILSFPPVQRWKCSTDRETIAHGGKTRFPWRIGVGHTITRRQRLPRLILIAGSFQ